MKVYLYNELKRTFKTKKIALALISHLDVHKAVKDNKAIGLPL